MEDKIKITSVQFNYNYEDNSLQGVGVSFECQLIEEFGVSAFSGTVQLAMEETKKYSLADIDKVVVEHISERLTAIIQEPETN